MNELSRCIVCLLADNDCVILPGIGGFIASYEPARYDIANKTFASPKRIIGFNSAITLNDGLLVQAYMQKTYVCGCMPPYESQVSHRLALSTDWLQYKKLR